MGDASLIRKLRTRERSRLTGPFLAPVFGTVSLHAHANSLQYERYQ